MLGDTAYDGDELRDKLDGRGTKPVIPNRSNRVRLFSFNKRWLCTVILTGWVRRSD
jgi:hypothetical protein